jgi:hypothetical protein
MPTILLDRTIREWCMAAYFALASIKEDERAIQVERERERKRERK